MRRLRATGATLALFALAGAAAGGAGVWAAGRFGGADTRAAAIGPQVRAYLLGHPEVIAEATQRLQDRETERVADANRAAIETPVGDALSGNPKGDVTLVEFYDYNCGYCRASLPAIRQLVASDRGVRIVYRELPVLAPSSRAAAEASLLAARAGRFPAFHDALFAAGPVSDASIAAAARAAGLDLSRLPAARAAADEDIRTNLALARALGMTGTPSWVVGGHVFVGALGLDGLRAAVAAARGH